MSAENAWRRLRHKLSPSKGIEYSPIRPCYHLLRHTDLYKENIFRAHVWTLLNTEEFHYQNSGTMVHHNSENGETLAQLLNDHRQVIQWSKRLTNYELIGTGAFGEVYRVTDNITGQNYAVKAINPPNENDISNLYTFLSSLFRERNSFSELNQSTFFVRMLGAFQSSDNTRFLFVLEYCFCTVYDLIRLYPDYEEIPKLTEDYFKGNSFKKVSKIMTKILTTDYQRLFFIYLFEMLCGLHYLASRHIVHADIKTENFLIDPTGHLKFSDFGLSFRTDWFYRNSASRLPHNKAEIDDEDQSDGRTFNKGTRIYYDPEMTLASISRKEKHLMPILTHKLAKSVYFQKLKLFHQNFLSDLFAVGLVAVEIFTGGVLLTESLVLPLKKTTSWTVESIYIPKLNSKVFNPLMKMTTCDILQSVFEFIRTIFQPRQIRSQLYRVEITKYQQKEIIKEFHLDIHSIENLLYYKEMSITKENVGNFVFQPSYMEKLLENMSTNEELIPQKKSRKKQIFNLYSLAFSSWSKNN